MRECRFALKKHQNNKKKHEQKKNPYSCFKIFLVLNVYVCVWPFSNISQNIIISIFQHIYNDENIINCLVICRDIDALSSGEQFLLGFLCTPIRMNIQMITNYISIININQHEFFFLRTHNHCYQLVIH